MVGKEVPRHDTSNLPMGRDEKHSSQSVGVFISHSETSVNKKVALYLIKYTSFPYVVQCTLM